MIGNRFLVVFLIVLLGACGQEPTPEARMQAAEELLAVGNYGEALIELRKAVASDPQSTAAWLAQGRAEYTIGDLDAAEFSVSRAIELGLESGEAIDLLLRIRLLERRANEVIAFLEDNPDVVDDETRAALRAEAMINLGRIDDAGAEIAGVGSLRNSDRGRLLMGRVLAASGDRDGAAAELRQVAEDSRVWPEAMLVLAAVLQQQNDLEAAERTVEMITSAGPGMRLPLRVAANRMLFDLQMARGSVEEGRMTLAVLSALAPGSPQTVIAEARIAFVSGDIAAASGPLQTLLWQYPENAQARLLLGIALVESGSVLQGEQQLKWLLSADPELTPARVALARAQIAQGKFDAAHALLSDAGPMAGPEIAALLGRVKLHLGYSNEAIAFLAAAAAASDAPDQLTLDLVEAHLQSGNVGEAARLLSEREFDAAYSDRVARLRLVTDGLARGPRYAVRALEAAVLDQPQDIRLRLLAASVYLSALDDPAAAERHVEAALELEPRNVEALYSQATLQVSRSDFTSAEETLNRILDIDANSVAAITLLARIATRQGDQGGARVWMDELNRIGSSRANHELLRVLILRGDWDAAERLAESMATDSGAGAYLAGIAYLQSGFVARALPVLREATRSLPDVPETWLMRGVAEARLGELDASLQSINRALQERPGWLQAVRVQLYVLTESDRNDEALRIVAELANEEPGDVRRRLLAAETLAAVGMYAEADARFGELPLAAMSSTQLFAWGQVRQRGGLPDPNEPLERWIVEYPDDASVRVVLVERLHQSGDSATAFEHLQHLLANRPNNAAILNNVAWYLYDIDNSELETAIDVARDAARISPDSGPILDTLGWLLTAAGEFDEAVEILRRATRLEPSDPRIREHLETAEARAQDS